MSKNKKNTSPNSSSSLPEGSRRAQLAAQTAREQRDRTIRKRIRLTLIVATVAAVLFGGIWIGGSAIGSRPAAGDTAADLTVGVGETTAPVRVDVYQDFMCPYCGQFELANGDDLRQLAEDGTIRLEIHPLNFLDSLSQGTKYSTRSANAFVAVAEADPAHVLDFNRALYVNQPAENTPGLTDEQIAQVALGVGIDQGVVDTFTDGAHETRIQEATQAALADGVTGTPAVMIDGEQFQGDIYSSGPLEAAIRAAADE